MNSSPLIWLVGFISYLPLHLGLPLLAQLIQRGELPKGYRTYLWQGALISAVVFVVAYFLSQQQLWWGLLLVLLSMPLPWLQLRGHKTSEKG